MELRHIRYFLAVAEERNFTRAAARVGIGQPPLSQQIRDLEKEIGTQLFRRVPHGAELTEAGEAFLRSVRHMPEHAAVAVRNAQRAARGESGALRVGYTPGAMLNELVIDAVRTFRRRYPEVELTLTEQNSVALEEALREGDLDLAFLRPTAGATDVLTFERLPDEPMVAALPLGHRLLTDSAGAMIQLADLRDEPFVFTPRELGPNLFDAAVEACMSVGFMPDIKQSAPQMASVVALVAAGVGVSIVPASMRQLMLPGVVFCEIGGAAPVARLALVHSPSTRSPLVRNFMTLERHLSTD